MLILAKDLYPLSILVSRKFRKQVVLLLTANNLGSTLTFLPLQAHPEWRWCTKERRKSSNSRSSEAQPSTPTAVAAPSTPTQSTPTPSTPTTLPVDLSGK